MFRHRLGATLILLADNMKVSYLIATSCLLLETAISGKCWNGYFVRHTHLVVRASTKEQHGICADTSCFKTSGYHVIS